VAKLTLTVQRLTEGLGGVPPIYSFPSGPEQRESDAQVTNSARQERLIGG
jgi:hypothetical protein